DPGAGGSPQGSGAGGSSQGSGAGGSSQGSGAGGSSQGSGAAGGSSQEPGSDGNGNQTPQISEHDGNGQGGNESWHHHSSQHQNFTDSSPPQSLNPPSPANGQSHGNSPDLCATADATHTGDIQDHAQALHLHFAHTWGA